MSKNNCMIFEVYNGSMISKSAINESQVGVPEGMMRVTGVAAVIGVKNRNGRIYTKENYLEHINRLQEDIAYGLYGELEHPEGYIINNNNISHKIEAVWFNEATSEVMITLLLLDTEKGKIAQSIIRSGGNLRVSSRAMGSVDKNNIATISKLVTFDIVGTPGFRETSLHLSENLRCIGSDNLSESYVMMSDFNESLNDNNKFNQNHSTIMPNNLRKLMEAAKRNQANNPSMMRLAEGIERYLAESFAPMVQEWLMTNLVPMYESYASRKTINESLGKTACSFGAYALMQKDVPTLAEHIFARINESKQQQAGQVVLTQAEQQAVQKCMQGQQLTQQEQKLAQQGQEKLAQQLQQQQVNETQNGQQQAGQVVLTQAEQQAVQKCMQGQQLTQQEQKLAQQGQEKLAKQLQQDGDNYLSNIYQQQGQQSVSQLKQQAQQLKQQIQQKNQELDECLHSLLESQEGDEDKISQQADQIRQEIQEAQDQLDQTEDQIKEAQQNQSPAMQQAQQQLAQGQEISNEVIDQLTQDEIDELIKQQQLQQDGDYEDPEDKNVFEGQQQLTQQQQQVLQQLQQGQQLTQEQQEVVQQLQHGQQLTQQQQQVLQKMCQEQQLTQQQQQVLQQMQQLPESDETITESLISRHTRETLGKSGSLLEALASRLATAKN